MAEMKTLTLNGVTYEVVDANGVRTVPQELTDEQKAQARENIEAVSDDEFKDVLDVHENLVDTKTLATKVESGGGTDYTSSMYYTWNNLFNCLQCTASLASNGRRLLAGQKIKVNEGETITISAEFMQREISEESTVCLGIENQYEIFTVTADTGVWQRFSNTIVVNSESALDTGIRVVAQRYNASSVALYVKNIHLVYGDKVYEYSPYGVKTTNVTNIEASQQKLESRVSALEIGSQIVGTSVGDNCLKYASLLNNSDKAESFLFFTDPHLAENDNYETQMRLYLKTLKSYYESTPTSFVICGGDWLGNSDTQKEACFKLGFIDAQMRRNFDRYYHVIGNHDTNYQGVIEDGDEIGTGILSNETIRNLMLRNEKKLYFSFDGANTKFYVLDTGSDWDSTMSNYRWEQIDWLAERLKEDDAKYTALALHIGYNSSHGQPLLSANVTALCEAYNNKTTITLNGVNYDFSSCTGNIKFILCGHIHADYVLVANGIPVISTTNTRAGNTPSFDLCLVDYDTDMLYMVRVGTGNSRMISLIDGTVEEIPNGSVGDNEPVLQSNPILLRAMNRTGRDFVNNVKNRIMYVDTYSPNITRAIEWSSVATGEYPYDTSYYPISIPSGATKVTVTCPTNVRFDIEEWTSANWDSNSGRLYHTGWQQSGYVHEFSENAGVFWVMFEDTTNADTGAATYDVSGISVVIE